MAKNERDAKPILRLFYKEFETGRKFGSNGIEITCFNQYITYHF